MMGEWKSIRPIDASQFLSISHWLKRCRASPADTDDDRRWRAQVALRPAALVRKLGDLGIYRRGHTFRQSGQELGEIGAHNVESKRSPDRTETQVRYGSVYGLRHKIRRRSCFGAVSLGREPIKGIPRIRLF
jgi:hypothetical protein